MGAIKLSYYSEGTAGDYLLKVIHIRSSNDYFSYGKILRSFVLGSGNERYLSTQHERDYETISNNSSGTGLDNRGARFYDSDVARFLSLDPAAMEYPSLSDYNYVAGNPIMFIDPDGRNFDTFGVDGDGNVRHIDDKKYYDKDGNEVDRLYALDGNNNIDKSKGFAESRVQDGSSVLERLSHSGKPKVNTISYEDETYMISNMYITYANRSHKNEVHNLFTFLSKNSAVEWSLVGFNNSNGSFGYQLGTYGLGNENFYAPTSPPLKVEGTTLNIVHSHAGKRSYDNKLESLDGDAGVGSRYLKRGAKSYEVYFPFDNSTWSIGHGGKINPNAKRTRF